MKQFFFFVLLLKFSLIHAVTTTISLDTLKQSSTWNDTVIVTKPVVIPEEITLTIAPGSVVLFQPACSLLVLGTLLAQGTAADSVLISATDTVKCWIEIWFGQRSTPGASILRYTRLQFAKNRRAGGAIRLYYHKGVKIEDCCFRRDSNQTYGGAIMVENSDLTIERTVFRDNYAQSGGAALFAAGSPVKLVNCSFVNNTTAGTGAAIHNYMQATHDTVVNCLFTGNSSGDAGGCITGSRYYLVNCTIAGNTSLKNSASLHWSSIVNSIFWKNSPSNIIDTDLTTFKNCRIGVDPMLTDIDKGDFVPALRSPCLDMGTADTTGLTLPLTDCAGQPRIHCGTVDIGAFERQPVGNNCPPLALDTSISLSWVYGRPLIFDTSLIRIHDYDQNELQFLVNPGTGYTCNAETLFIDSGRITAFKAIVYATDGNDTTRGIPVTIFPETAPVLTAVTSPTIRKGDQFTITLSTITAFDLDKKPQAIKIVVHPGENYSVLGTTITALPGFLGDLSVPVHVTDSIYSSDTLIMTIHVVQNSIPVLTEVKPQQMDQWLSFTVSRSMFTATDGENDQLYPVIEAGANYTVNGSTIKPDSSFLGTLTIPLRVTDKRDTSNALPFLLTVIKVNHKPVIQAAVGGTYRDCDNISFTMEQVSAYDPDHDSIHLILFPGSGYTVSDHNRISPDSCNGTLKVAIAVSDGVDTAKKVIIDIVIISKDAPVVIPSERPLARNGKLMVKNGTLCNHYGFPVQLKGMSSHGLQWYGNYMNINSIEWLVADWHASVVRAAMYTDEGGYITNDSLKQTVRKIALAAKKAGIYCIIDWHILYDGDPNKYKSAAITFFTEMAMTFKDESHILYEICNEPNGKVTWDAQIRPYAEEVIRAIRTHDSTGVILVGSSTWSQDVDIVATSKLPFDNIAYTLHFYAGTHGDKLKGKLQTALDSGLAVFASEWGTSTSSGSGGVFAAESDRWLRLLDSANISWCNWSLCDKGESSAALKYRANALGSWPDSMLSTSGLYTRDRMRNDQINDPPALLPVNADTVHAGDSVALKMQAFDPDLYQQLTWGLEHHPKGMSIDSSGFLSWVAEDPGLHTITITVSDDSGSSATTSYALMVEPPVATANRLEPEGFCILGFAQKNGEILFRFNPRNPTPYCFRIFSMSGRMVAEVSGITRRRQVGQSTMEKVPGRIPAAGIYLAEFTYPEENGSIRKVRSVITGVRF